MSPLTLFILIACLKNVKVSEINTENEFSENFEAGQELDEFIEDGYYEFEEGEVEHDENNMSIRIFTKIEFRIALKDKRAFWPNGIVPYVISKKYDANQKKVILEAMDAFKGRTCIRFIPRNNESAFIFIEPRSGCSATIGKAPKNVVRLGRGCFQKGVVIHELMHSLGFLHEQSRPDRDQFVTINYSNVKEKQRKNFDKYEKNRVQDGNISYDYDSIMHYGPFTFAKNRSVPTIIPKQKGVTIGQRNDLSKKDIEKINIFYNCNKEGRRRVKRHESRNYNMYFNSKTLGVAEYPIILKNRPRTTSTNRRRINSSQIGRRVKRHDNEQLGSYFPEPPNRRPHVTTDRRTAAFPTNARKPNSGSQFPGDFEKPNFEPVRNPSSGQPRPIPPYRPQVIRHNPAQLSAHFDHPAYSSVQQAHEAADHPKVIHVPAGHPSVKPSDDEADHPKVIHVPAGHPPVKQFDDEADNPKVEHVPAGHPVNQYGNDHRNVPANHEPVQQSPDEAEQPRVIHVPQGHPPAQQFYHDESERPKVVHVPAGHPPAQQPHDEAEQPMVKHISAGHPKLYEPAIPQVDRAHSSGDHHGVNEPAMPQVERDHSLEGHPTPRRLNHSSVEYRRGYYYGQYPPRFYPHRPFPMTPGYDRVRYPPFEYQRPGYQRPSFTTAGYREPVYPRPVKFPQIFNPYTPIFFETSTTINTEVTDIQGLTSEGTTTVQTSTISDTTTSAPTSTLAETTTSLQTTTVSATTTVAPTTTTMVPTTTTMLPITTTMVPTTTTMVPTTTTMVPTTTTMVPTTTTVVPTTTTVVPTTTTMVPTTTESQTTTSIATTTSVDTTTIAATEFSSISPLFTEDENDDIYADIFGDKVGYHRIRVFPTIESRTALKDPTALWTRGIVPYELSDQYDTQQQGFMLEAMQEFHNKTCVRFVPRRNEASYISIEPEQRCSAPIGRVPGGPSRVLISEGCYLQGTIIHELMHILGFVHEQNRPDRDQFVIVMWDNIIPEGKRNFNKYSWDEVQDFGIGYDYESVMHYGSTEFAIDPNRPTLVPLQPGVELGQREGFSRKDLAKVNRLYKCRSEQAKEVVTSSPVEEFKKYFQSNVQRLFRSLLRAISNFKPSKPK